MVIFMQFNRKQIIKQGTATMQTPSEQQQRRNKRQPQLAAIFSCSSRKLSLNFCRGWNGRSASSVWARSISSRVYCTGLPPLSMKCKSAAGMVADSEDETMGEIRRRDGINGALPARLAPLHSNSAARHPFLPQSENQNTHCATRLKTHRTSHPHNFPEANTSRNGQAC